jgi:radical SAM superfamily enzyme YgiQ (UPF0313 family)
MTKRLLLINPGNKDKLNMASVGLFLTFAPPTLGYLAALTPPDWDVRLADENVEDLAFEDADLVGITAMSSSAPRAYEISEEYRRRGIKTVIGGIHATVLPREAARHVDSVVIGEAESVWGGLLRDFEQNKLRRFYKADRLPMENLPGSRIDLYSDGYRVKASVQTGRGCPFDCEFCSVTAFHGRTYRQRPVEEVLDELEALDCRDFYFTDDNFIGYGARAEERAIRLLRGMTERRLGKRWFGQVSIDFAGNPEVLKWAGKSGCIAVCMGIESVSEESLEGMHKVRNLKVGVDNYRSVIKRVHDHGIGIHGNMILGNDGDRKDIFERTVEFVLDSKVDTVNLALLVPLPGTRLYDRMRAEGRLLRTNYPEDWKHYDMAEAVFRPKHMSPDELEDGLSWAYEQITSRKASLRRACNTLISTKNPRLASIAYSLNRGYNWFVPLKYQHVMSERAREAMVPRPLHFTPAEEASEEELVETR